MNKLIVFLLSLTLSNAVVLASDANSPTKSVLPADGTVCFYEQLIENLLVDESDEARYYSNVFSCTIIGDETIDGHIYKKILYKNMSQNLPETLSLPESEIYYVTENEGVISSHDVTDHPIIDFRLKAGAIYNIYIIEEEQFDDSNGRIVKADEFIKVKNRIYRRLTITDAFGNPVDYWVEGIGSANSDYISKYYATPTNGIVEHEPKLMSVYNPDNELIFEYSDFSNADKVAGIELDVVRNDSEIDSVRIYDIYGRELMTLPENNIYIINGKKFVNRK